jgi:hypothetical protein
MSLKELKFVAYQRMFSMNRESKLVNSKDMKKITCFSKYKCHRLCYYKIVKKKKIYI